MLAACAANHRITTREQSCEQMGVNNVHQLQGKQWRPASLSRCAAQHRACMLQCAHSDGLVCTSAAEQDGQAVGRVHKVSTTCPCGSAVRECGTDPGQG